MSDRKTVVLADSGCDVPKKFREELDIRILPLRVIYPEKTIWTASISIR